MRLPLCLFEKTSEQPGWMEGGLCTPADMYTEMGFVRKAVFRRRVARRTYSLSCLRQFTRSFYWLLCFSQIFFHGGMMLGSSQTISDDVMGLLVFKAGISDPYSELDSWNDMDLNPCNWTGVYCSPSTGRVTELRLTGLSLTGTVGRALVKLEQLQTLDLSCNNLSGGLIAEVTQIPTLTSINVSHNTLSGSIPPQFGNAGQLYSVDLSSNAFSGTFFPEIFSSACQTLRYISVADNQLRGPVPGTVGACLGLQGLSFSSNAFSGEIPNGVWALESLQSLDFSSNTLTGQIPDGIGLLANLTSLHLQNNFFAGPVPAGLGNCAKLQVLDLSRNAFSGEVPPQLGNLGSLVVLNLWGNSLYGSFPSWLANMTTLREVNLAWNRFQGPIPSSVSLLPHLAAVDLSGNYFSGPIPTWTASRQTLQNIRLANNLFTGLVPNFTGGGPGCQALEYLDLSANQLVGNVPTSLAACLNLRYLSLAENTLTSSVPVALGSLAALEVLDLSNNSLTGNIPNSLDGATQIQTLLLQWNLLNGTVPEELGNLTHLTKLNLSQNNLTGQIPENLGRLQNLKFLDLSYNLFLGQIPANLGQMPNLQLINVSHNELQGPVPVTGVFSRMNDSAFSHNAGLCGSVVNLSCSAFPNPGVINPNDPDSIPGTLSPLLRSKRSRTILSVSAIAAISAAAVIALGVIFVTFLNLCAQTRGKSDMFLGIGDPQSPRRGNLPFGKLVMFTHRMDPKSDEWMNYTHAILDKDCEIGRGGFGTVFKATLAQGETVAVKKLMVASLVKTRDEFENVIHMLGNVKHPNLVGLQGYYWTEHLQLIVYDYIPKGNLYSQLHERGLEEPPLSWRLRFKIALGTAQGLAHLHHGCIPSLIHYDVKSSNILLDENYDARLSDYSLARLLPKLDTYVMSSKMQSALGYMAPEFACQSLKITEKFDVYGFGVLLLELVTGRRPVEYMEDDVFILCDFVRALLNEGRALTCVDSRLHGFPEDEVLPIVKLGLICTSQIPSNRPSMAEVVQILELIRPLVESRPAA